jgi:hypothetical protein
MPEALASSSQVVVLPVPGVPHTKMLGRCRGIVCIQVGNGAKFYLIANRDAIVCSSTRTAAAQLGYYVYGVLHMRVGVEV